MTEVANSAAEARGGQEHAADGDGEDLPGGRQPIQSALRRLRAGFELGELGAFGFFGVGQRENLTQFVGIVDERGQ